MRSGQGNDGPEMLDEILSGGANSPSVERIDKTSTSLAERLKNGRFKAPHVACPPRVSGDEPDSSDPYRCRPWSAPRKRG